MNLYEEEYWNITANSTGVSYDLNRSVMPWNYTQCAIADSQFFWDGTLLMFAFVSLPTIAQVCVCIDLHIMRKYAQLLLNL